jgi:hypothetical protein
MDILLMQIKRVGSGGIRTHASEETGALNQRLRPLGHATRLFWGARQVREASMSAAQTDNSVGARRDRETFDYCAIKTRAPIKIHSIDYIIRLIAIASCRSNKPSALLQSPRSPFSPNDGRAGTNNFLPRSHRLCARGALELCQMLGSIGRNPEAASFFFIG